MRLPLLSLAALAALAVVSGCDAGADAIGLTGTWEGEIYDAADSDAPRYDVTLRLSDNGQSVSGTGTAGSNAGDQTFSVSGGSFVGTAVTLPLFFASEPIPGRLTGTLTNQTPGRIEGTFSGPADLDGDVRIELVAR